MNKIEKQLLKLLPKRMAFNRLESILSNAHPSGWKKVEDSVIDVAGEIKDAESGDVIGEYKKNIRRKCYRLDDIGKNSAYRFNLGKAWNADMETYSLGGRKLDKDFVYMLNVSERDKSGKYNTLFEYGGSVMPNNFTAQLLGIVKTDRKFPGVGARILFDKVENGMKEYQSVVKTKDMTFSPK